MIQTLRRHGLLTLSALVLGIGSASAQTGPCPTALDLAINPTVICVIPSSTADHLRNDPLDTATIARYDVLFFAPGVNTATGTPVQVVNVGKPALNTDGVFWVTRSELASIPLGQQYRARVVAVNASNAASARSPESNPFGRPTGTAPAAPSDLRVR
jgi:hypothetical protein